MLLPELKVITYYLVGLSDCVNCTIMIILLKQHNFDYITIIIKSEDIRMMQYKPS